MSLKAKRKKRPPILDIDRDAAAMPEPAPGSSGRKLALPPEKRRKLQLIYNDPAAIGRYYLRRRHDPASDGTTCATLLCHRGRVAAFRGNHFADVSDGEITADVNRTISDNVELVTRTGIPQPLAPRIVDDVVRSLKQSLHLPDAVESPALLDSLSLCRIDPDGTPQPVGGPLTAPQQPDPHNLLQLTNCYLDASTGATYWLSPALYAKHPCSYPRLPDARAPLWEKMTSDVFANDDKRIALLQEWFGYSLLGGLDLQKALMLIGPPRSGKGLILRIIMVLIGEGATATPTLSSLATRFGMSELDGRRLACVTDGRLGHRSDADALAETILTLTGGDAVRVERKYAPAETARRIRAKLIVTSNELPAFHDASGALAERFLPLETQCSFLGREDSTLFDRLMAELPGILNWSLEGARRLLERGRFDPPAESREAVDQLAELASPVRGFVKRCCVIKPGVAVKASTLYLRFQKWCHSQGVRDCDARVFGRDLRAAFPSIRHAQRREDGVRQWLYEGVTVTVTDKSQSLSQSGRRAIPAKNKTNSSLSHSVLVKAKKSVRK